MDINEKQCNTYTFQKENDHTKSATEAAAIAAAAFIDDKTGTNSNSPLLKGFNVSSNVMVMDEPFQSYSKRRYNYTVL